ncbi:MAG: hypothetical protein PHR11_04345 [Candidatus Omnitrophica bacterium]|nr:hypothetical protein [Candidatus Omnitrophota bacterium]
MRVLKALASRVRRYRVWAYFAALFGALLAVYYPSFFHPPRSDYWPALYFFYRIDAIGGPLKWACLLAHDPLINATFRPLSFLMSYGEHLVFGSRYVFPQILNFSFYCASIFLLYKTAMVFSLRKGIVLALLFLFGFLFSHFDIVCWAFHSHIILSFCLFLCAFLLYDRYERSGNKFILAVIAFLSLCGMLLYEVFFLWPLSFALLYWVKRFSRRQGLISPAPSRAGATIALVVAIYAVYAALFCIDRMFKAYRGPGISLSPLFLLTALPPSVFLVFLNVFYNNILINLLPWLAYPLDTGDNNLNMSGLIGRVPVDIDILTFAGGGAVAVAIVLAAVWLYRQKNRLAFGAFVFFMYLLLSELFILFWFKSLVNSSLYNLTQFRFQYIPNAFVLLALACFVQGLEDRRRIIAKAAFLLLVVSLVLNIRSSKAGVLFLTRELAPVRVIITNIARGLDEQRITPDKKLFIDREVVKKLPSLCWNNEMGQRCMRGTYEWLFPPRQIDCFSGKEEAAWIIDQRTLKVTAKK